jgi:hypothetical protein
MDRITTGLLGEFTKEFELSSLAEDKQFEHFATYVCVRRHYSDSTFDPCSLVTGDGNDTGIDGVAIIANNNIVDEIDEVDELLSVNGYLDVTFVFIQAERSSNFETAKIGTFGYGVRDFFGPGTLVRNDNIKNAHAIMNAIFKMSAKFTKGNPGIAMYYVTTGKWQNDANLIARYESETNYLRDTGNFRSVSFFPIGADQVQKMYYQTKNAISREFLFERKTVVPNINNVKAAYLGLLTANEFLKIICDEDDELIDSLFYENVRGWEGYNQINQEIKDTLQSGENDRFVLMNNGVTIIAKSLLTTGDKFTMGDFQIVNGCQTSNVLYDNRAILTDAVRIPIRIICTTDDAVAESVITATNRQTEVKQEQFFALKDFAKKLEAFFKSFDVSKRLYYERRTHQYDSSNIEKTRIIVHKDLVRAVGAMFFQEPHRTTRSYKNLSARVGRDMFISTDRPEPYYVAGFTLYKLNSAFNTAKMSTALKIARYQILLTARLLIDAVPLPRMNSNDMERRCGAMMERLWGDPDRLLSDAAFRFETIVGGNMDRDYIHTQGVTDLILESFGHKKGAAL